MALSAPELSRAECFIPHRTTEVAQAILSGVGRQPALQRRKLRESFMNYSLGTLECRNFEVSSRKEWMIANGLGGYAMGTVSGANMRRYHGLLVAATEPPAHRMVLLANIEGFIQTDGEAIGIACNQYQGTIYPEGYQYLKEFTLGMEQAIWTYELAGCRLEKAIRMHQGSNTVTIVYRNTGNRAFGLTLRPLVCHKFYHANFRYQDGYPGSLLYPKGKTVVTHDGTSLSFLHPGALRVPSPGWYYRFEYTRDLERGLDPRDDLFCPCELRYELVPGEQALIVCTTQASAKPKLPEAPDATTPSLREGLQQAAQKFFIDTKSRVSIIAGYPWFTDWGRDTMISLPGLCLHTGRHKEAKRILSDYASQMSQGLIPNRFVEAGGPPEYNTVDATLWMVHAIWKVLESEWDPSFARRAIGWFEEIFRWHRLGTLYSIQVDETDGLLTQGESGRQLTWMDAIVDDWVVTPRYGKPVEVNGLWINALHIMALVHERLGRPTEPYFSAAKKAAENFDRKFWKETLGYYMDTADPDDASLRPNQVIALSLPFVNFQEDRAKRALAAIEMNLLTELGLRTLSPDDPQYRGRFKGPLNELDAAYHQGTVWPWLLGPYVTAMRRFGGEKKEAKRILSAAKFLLHDGGLGGIAEVYDGDEPRSAGGCPWQAWSVAEILRSWVEDAEGK